MAKRKPAKVTVTAVSFLSSRTLWLNAAALLVAVLSATDVLAIIPARYLSIYGAVLASLNIFLRMVTVQPLAIISPGETKRVEIDKVGPPPPAMVTD